MQLEFEPDVEEFRAEELRAAGLPIVRIPVTSFAKPSVLANARIYCRNSKGSVVCLDVKK